MHPDLVRRTTTARIPTAEGTFQLSHYVDARDGKEHLALVMGDVQNQQNVLARVHSECFTGDVLGSQRCDCGEQLHQAMRLIAQEGQGVILYLRQEGRGIGLEQKLKAYNLQDQGYDTVDANLMLGHQADEREYSAAAAILSDLGILSIRLMTNNPTKIDHLADLGIAIIERLPLSSTVTHDNAAYLATKVERMRHLLTLPVRPPAYTNGHAHIDDHAHKVSGAEVERQLAALGHRALEHYAQRRQPFVTLSYAQTLDGTIGTAVGDPLRISGPESLVVTHQLRARHDAILVGIGTLLADNPQLTVRLVEGPDPQPIIVDSHLRLPVDARIFSHPKSPWIATLDTESAAAHTLRERGITLLSLPSTLDGKVNLKALFSLLGDKGIRSVMVEGGASIIASLIRQQLAHYAIITIAPRFVPGISVLTPGSQATAALHHVTYTQAGNDIIAWGDLEWSPNHAGAAIPVNHHTNNFVPSSPPTTASPTVSPSL
ncbi:MAG: GTP cyclohydrolase II [Caldilineaceae bacterium]|nr:GTP cyclohydrolase II [Caldilineaceae bacterium]